MTTETMQRQPTVTTDRPRVRPLTDVFETPEAIVLVADVPGADQDSIELSLAEDVLTLRARQAVRPAPAEPAGERKEGPALSLHDYERSFRIGADLDRESLSATLQNGRLRVVLKKRQPSRIAVRTG